MYANINMQIICKKKIKYLFSSLHLFCVVSVLSFNICTLLLSSCPALFLFDGTTADEDEEEEKEARSKWCRRGSGGDKEEE